MVAAASAGQISLTIASFIGPLPCPAPFRFQLRLRPVAPYVRRAE
jgi:hypothetical protein